MKLLVGLGNPGKEYEQTRHNIGFLFLDQIKHLEHITSPFTHETKFRAEISRGVIAGEEWWMVKPQTFMNDSGDSVKALISFFKLEPKRDVIVAHDDLDIPFGSWKVQKGKGPRVHNGLISIEQQLKNPAFWRIRFGTDSEVLTEIKKEGRSVAAEYVLKPFTQKEKDSLPNLFSQAWQELLRVSKTC